MVECETIEEAQKVKGVIHIEASKPVRAYQAGDELPAHLKVDPTAEEPVSELEQIKQRLLVAEEKLTELLDTRR